MTTATKDTKPPRTRERMVRAVVILTTVTERRTDGSEVSTDIGLHRAQVAEFGPVEEARLEAAGALCPVGQTLAELEAEIGSTIAASHADRQSVVGL